MSEATTEVLLNQLSEDEEEFGRQHDEQNVPHVHTDDQKVESKSIFRKFLVEDCFERVTKTGK